MDGDEARRRPSPRTAAAPPTSPSVPWRHGQAGRFTGFPGPQAPPQCMRMAGGGGGGGRVRDRRVRLGGRAGGPGRRQRRRWRLATGDGWRRRGKAPVSGQRASGWITGPGSWVDAWPGRRSSGRCTILLRGRCRARPAAGPASRLPSARRGLWRRPGTAAAAAAAAAADKMCMDGAVRRLVHTSRPHPWHIHDGTYMMATCLDPWLHALDAAYMPYAMHPMSSTSSRPPMRASTRPHAPRQRPDRPM